MEQNKQPLDALLSLAAQKTGKDPSLLREQMEAGKIDGLLGNLPEEKKQQVNALLQDPKAMEEFMQRPQVQALLKALGAK